MGLLLAASKSAAQAQQEGAGLDGLQVQTITQQYRAWLGKGLAQNRRATKAAGQRGRAKQSSNYKLLRRLEKHEQEVLRFMRDSSVPFTNNLAKQAMPSYAKTCTCPLWSLSTKPLGEKLLCSPQALRTRKHSTGASAPYDAAIAVGVGHAASLEGLLAVLHGDVLVNVDAQVVAAKLNHRVVGSQARAGDLGVAYEFDFAAVALGHGFLRGSGGGVAIGADAAQLDLVNL
jgi:hypothetical protein